MDNELILNDANELSDYMLNTRRYLHENPELSGVEYETSSFLKKEVQKLGLEIHDVEGTGFFAVLDTGRPGKTLGLRTDIDALPIKEADYNSKKKRLVKSKNDGVFHACGHDGHMTILLSAMKILVKEKEKLKGKIIFIFEEGEETNSGISKMLKGLETYKFDAIYGNHLASFLETGKIGIDEGAIMAGFGMVDFTIKGKGGHGSRPDLAVNPIFASSEVINALASAWVNRIDVGKTVTLGLGSINGGKIANVIPDTVDITGTLRFFDLEEGEKALNLVRRVGTYTAKAHECDFIENEIAIKNKPLVNDSELISFARKSIGDIMPEALTDKVSWYASETFGSYSTLAPSIFILVGTKNEEKGTSAEHHNEYFDIDEDSLAIGTKAMVKFAIDFLTNN